MRRNVVGTVLITLLVVGALGAIGFGVWQMGYQRGLVETGAEVVVNTGRQSRAGGDPVGASASGSSGSSSRSCCSSCSSA